MRLSIHTATGIALTLTIAFNGVAFGDDPVVDASPPKDAAKPDVPPVAKPVAEELKLEAVTLPRRVMRRAVGLNVAPNAADPMNNRDAQVQAFVQQCRPYLDIELRIVRLTCSDLPVDLRIQLKKAIDARLVAASTKEVSALNGNEVLLLNRAGRARRISVPGSAGVVHEAVIGAMKDTVSEEHRVRYADVSQSRADNRKRAAVMDLVSRLDSELYLTLQQREKITNSFSSNWDESLEGGLFQPLRYFPLNIDNFIVQFLNEDQLAVWQSLPKVNVQMNVNIEIEMQNDDTDWWGQANENPNRPDNRR